MRTAPIFFVCLAAFFAIELFAQKPATETVSGDVNVTQPGESTELAIGKPVPDFQLQTIGDEPVILSERFARSEGDDDARPNAPATDEAATDEAAKKGKPVILLFSRANW